MAGVNNESKRYKVAVLADAVHDKRERLKMLGIMNTPTDPDKRRAAAIEYALAQADLAEAERALREAIEEK